MIKVTNKELRKIYENLPGSYDKVNRIISFYQDIKWRAELIKTSLKYNFEIFAENRKEKVAEGYVVIVTIDMKTFKAVNIPPFIIEKLQKLA